MSLFEQWLIPPSITTVYINEFVSSLVFIHHCILFSWIVYQNYKSLELPSSQSLGKSLLIWTLISIGLYIPCSFGIIIQSFDYFIQYLQLDCNYCYIISTITYWFGKYAVWMYSIIRVKVVFRNSAALRYSPKLLFFFEILFHVFLILNITLSVFTLDHTVISIDSISVCIPNIPFWVILIAFSLDSIAMFICFYLFQRKIQLLLNMEGKGNDAEHNDFLYVLRKYKILLITVIVSSWIAGGMYAFFTALLGLFGSIDTIINIWCLVLFDVRYNKLYQRIFGCCISSSSSSPSLQAIASNLSTDGTHNAAQVVIH